MPPGSPEASARPIPHLNNILVTGLLECAKEIADKAEKHYSDARILVHRLDETKQMISQLQKVTATVSPMVELSSKCYMLMLDNCSRFWTRVSYSACSSLPFPRQVAQLFHIPNRVCWKIADEL